jgi:magnesium-transporting ATPase (P-type)
LGACPDGSDRPIADQVASNGNTVQEIHSIGSPAEVHGTTEDTNAVPHDGRGSRSSRLPSARMTIAISTMNGTAVAIGKEIGLVSEGALVIEGHELHMMDDKELGEKLENGQVLFARMTPKHKMRIVSILKQQGERLATTACLTAIIVTQITNVFACRSSRESVFKLGLFSNPLIFVGIAVALLFQVFIVYHPIGNRIFATALLSLWVLLVPFALLFLFAEEMRKLVSRHLGASAQSLT